jgi:hypothetical protein
MEKKNYNSRAQKFKNCGLRKKGVGQSRVFFPDTSPCSTLKFATTLVWFWNFSSDSQLSSLKMKRWSLQTQMGKFQPWKVEIFNFVIFNDRTFNLEMLKLLILKSRNFQFYKSWSFQPWIVQTFNIEELKLSTLKSWNFQLWKVETSNLDELKLATLKSWNFQPRCVETFTLKELKLSRFYMFNFKLATTLVWF